ncbi:MAG TPA: hypothetical protein VM261_38270 [Kofleriaceae bacterium]|nr:hypothetical protein [Kofleriaceae bacterium]
MGRLAALLGLTLAPAIASALASALTAGCTTPAGCPDVAASFALTAPGGATELVPGSTVRLTWEPITGTSAVVAFVLVDGDERIPTGTAEVSAGMHEFSTTNSGAPIAPGVYRIQGAFGGCALSEPAYDAGALRLVFAQGVTFADTSLTITGAQTPRDIAFTTVSLSSFELELLVDPTPGGAAGDELVFATGTVPGELVAMNRRYAFTGTTTTSTAIPAGTYGVVARVHARNGTLTYDVPGPQLTWTP